MSQPTQIMPVPALVTDHSDARRLIQAAMLVAALPNICSEQARALSAAHLRSVLARHPSPPPVLVAIIRHLENPGAE